MLTVPFLTDLDSRAAIKGSRDPLGIQQIWTRLGRHIIGNLTTVSNSVRDFTTLLLGYYFTEQLANDRGPGTELSTFLKWEQLAAYSRAVENNDWAFRGSERVRKNLSETSRVTLSADSAHQILGNQKIYGLWGLYTMPARASSLVDGDPPKLTPPALDLVEKLYLRILGKEGAGTDAKRILDVLKDKSSRVEAKKGEALIRAVGNVLQRRLLDEERNFYRIHLLHGGPQDKTEGKQRQLAELLTPTLRHNDFSWSPTVVKSLSKSAIAKGNKWHQLSYRLKRIHTGEAVFAPMAALFTYLLGLDGMNINNIVRRLCKQWGKGLKTIDLNDFGELRTEIGAGDSATGDRWVEIARTAANGEYANLIDLLISQNKAVMAARGGAPWVDIRGGILQVRFHDEQGDLPSRDKLYSFWRFPYFLDSLRSMATELKVKDDD